MRMSHDQLDQLMIKYKTDRFWSFSRINSYLTCPMNYFLSYIKKVQAVDEGIYGVAGGGCHDILERFYSGEIKYEQMIEEFDNLMLNLELSDLKFDSSNEEKNGQIRDKYVACLRHFFMNYIPIGGKVALEKFIVIKVGDEYFQGYIDCTSKEEDKFVITDFKTSTIYVGQKIKKEARQLLLYAYALMQKGVPLNKIKIRWDFLKYLTVSYKQKNGKIKETKAERWAWVGKIVTPLKRNLKDSGYEEEEIESLINQCLACNSLTPLPKEVQDLYTLNNCYVEIPLDKEEIEKLVEDLAAIMKDIREKEQHYKKNKDESIWYKIVEDKDSYFCNNLCGFTTLQCECFKEYMENKEMYIDNEIKDNWLEELDL